MKLNSVGGRPVRSVGYVIEINTGHAEFQNRLKSRYGLPQMNDRLSFYLSNLIASEYRQIYYETNHIEPSRSKIALDFVTDAARLETVLRKKLKDFVDLEGADATEIQPPM